MSKAEVDAYNAQLPPPPPYGPVPPHCIRLAYYDPTSNYKQRENAWRAYRGGPEPPLPSSSTPNFPRAIRAYECMIAAHARANGYPPPIFSPLPGSILEFTVS